MECEICGSPGAAHTILLEGNRLLVCGNCASLGKEIKREEAVKPGRKVFAEPRDVEDDFDFVENYGAIIKSAREHKGLTVEELSKKAYIKESFMHKIEQGRLKPELQMARKLENLLCITLIEKEAQESGKEK